MLRPTYNDLIDSMNKNREEGEPEVQSRYSVVIASAKRARQIISGDAPLLPGEEGKKPLSIAIEEISKNLVHVEKGLDYEKTMRTMFWMRIATKKTKRISRKRREKTKNSLMKKMRMIILMEIILRTVRNNEFIFGEFGL